MKRTLTREETNAIYAALEALENQNENWDETLRATPSDERDPHEIRLLQENEHYARVLERLHQRAVAELSDSSFRESGGS